MNGRTFLRYVLQNIAGMIGLSCYILVDTLFVSIALGASGLAALNLSITVFSIVAGIGQMLGIGGGTDYALRRAEGRDASRSLSTSLLCGVAFSLLFMLVGVFLAGPLSRLLSYTKTTVALLSLAIFALVFLLAGPIAGAFNHEGDTQLLSIAVSGLRIYFAGYLFAGINIAAAALLSAVGRPHRALLISLLRSCVLLVPAALLLSRLLAVPGVWLSFVVTEAVCCVLSLLSIRLAASGRPRFRTALQE